MVSGSYIILFQQTFDSITNENTKFRAEELMSL